jgi:hypothetical protein
MVWYLVKDRENFSFTLPYTKTAHLSELRHVYRHLHFYLSILEVFEAREGKRVP